MSRAHSGLQSSSSFAFSSGSGHHNGSSTTGTIQAIDMPSRAGASSSGSMMQQTMHGQSSSTTSAFFQPINASQRSQRHNVHVLFLAPDQRGGDHFLNRVTAMIGRKVHKQGFCHVEIVIPDMESSTLACPSYLSSSIYNGETVTLTKTKTFANPGYTVFTFTVDGVELSRIADYLFDSKRMQLGFDSLGMYLAALPFQVNPFASTQRTTFCSKHVTKALKAAGIEGVCSLNENIVTPSKLYRVLHDQLPKERLVVGSVQYKQKALMEQGSVAFSVQ